MFQVSTVETININKNTTAYYIYYLIYYITIFHLFLFCTFSLFFLPLLTTFLPFGHFDTTTYTYLLWCYCLLLVKEYYAYLQAYSQQPLNIVI